MCDITDFFLGNITNTDILLDWLGNSVGYWMSERWYRGMFRKEHANKLFCLYDNSYSWIWFSTLFLPFAFICPQIFHWKILVFFFSLLFTQFFFLTQISLHPSIFLRFLIIFFSQKWRHVNSMKSILASIVPIECKYTFVRVIARSVSFFN